MHIAELQLIGFKSFQEKTTLRFSPGLNAVIGPNGCGKTNVLDALRWVLGEQSFTLLRCSRNEDLIFGGTAAVPATNYAEVRLVLAGVGPDDTGASEVEIRRRYFRSGESEYYLNRQPCRLRDIQEVFFSSGAGTKAYSIFDLRQMREIISGNIRKMFEEAASLAKYQDAKADCLRKLALTEADLTRLDDITGERERLVRSLQRQSGRLRAWDKLKAEEKSLRLLVLRGEYASLRRELERAQADTASLEEADAARLAEIHRLEEELRLHRAKLRDLQAHKDDLAARIRSQRQVISELESKDLLGRQRIGFLQATDEQALADRSSLAENVRRLEEMFQETLSRLATAGQRQEAAQHALDELRAGNQAAEEKLYNLRRHEAALREQVQDLIEEQHVLRQDLARLEAARDNQRESGERLAGELAATKARQAKAQADARDAGNRLASTAQAIAAGRERRTRLEAELAAARDRRNQTRTDIARLRDERTALEKDLAVLHAALATEQTEVSRSILGADVLGEVSRSLVPAQGWEQACEAALYQVVDFLVTRSGASAETLAALARTRPDLRFGFLAASPGAQAANLKPPAPDPSILGPLTQYVQVRDGAPEALRQMLDLTLVVDGAASFERLARACPGWSFVTRDGVCRFSDGRLVLASRDRGRLSISRLVDRKSARVTELDAELKRLETEEAVLVRSRDELARTLNQTEFELAESEAEKGALGSTVAAFSAAAEELERDAGRVRAEQRGVETQHQTADGQSATLTARIAELDRRIEATSAALQGAEAETAEVERLVKEGLERSTAALAELSEARQAAMRLETENTFAKRTIDDSRRRLSQFEQAVADARTEAARLEAEIAGRSGEVGAARQVLAGMEDETGKLHIADLSRAEEELGSNLDELRRTQEQSQKLLLEQRLKLHELNRRSADIVEEAGTGYATDITQTPEPDAEPATPDPEPLLAQVRHRLEALGQINPLAAEEYSREKSDLERMRTQRQDVAGARANLEQTLVEIDRHAQEQFATTYAEVRGHFREIFRELFLEGEADLVMVNDANPLESEIGIIARPRGKNPKRLEQLSDGEKALLAVSLLFAFYRVKPAPFCFLDEVDAPLDDANVGRFADYLRAISSATQVVIITHNRLTVERAGVVFGVTAEQPGISKLISVSLAEYHKQAAG